MKKFDSKNLENPLTLPETLLALQAEENSAGWHFAIRKSAE